MSFDSLRNSLSIAFRILMAALRLASCWLYALAVPENFLSILMKIHPAVQVNCLAWAGLCENKTLNLKYMETLFKSEKKWDFITRLVCLWVWKNRRSLFVHLIPGCFIKFNLETIYPFFRSRWTQEKIKTRRGKIEQGKNERNGKRI